MLQIRSRLDVADNTGARMAKMIGVIGKKNSPEARIGDVITAHVREACSGGTVKKGEVVRAVVVRTRQPDPPRRRQLPALRQQRHRHHRQGSQSARHPHLRPGCPRTPREELHEDRLPRSGGALNEPSANFTSKRATRHASSPATTRAPTGKVLAVLPKEAAGADRRRAADQEAHQQVAGQSAGRASSSAKARSTFPTSRSSSRS